MSKETTRRNAENRRGQVVEIEQQEPIPPAVDEDAAAFLQEAAEAAAAAALEAEALAAEVGELEPLSEASSPEADEILEAGLDEALAEGAGAETSEAAEAALDEALAEAAGAEAIDPFEEELAAAEAAVAEAERVAASMEEPFAAGAVEGPDEVASPGELEAEMARDAEAEPTADEQALAEAERDPDEEVAPAEIAEVDEEAAASFEKLVARSRRLSEEQARNVIHSLLFVADKPLTIEQIRNATGLEPARIKYNLEKLAGDLREGISGVVLSNVAGGWQLRTAPESAEYVRRFLQVKPRRLTRAALETLAIIAYRQPVTRPEIEDIRGVDCGAVIKALLDWKLIKILGKKDEVGRPLLYGTSREFLEFFQLKDLASLPTLREFHELNEESVQIVEEELGPEAAAGIAGTVAELTDPAYLEAERERIAKSEQALAELEQALAEAEKKSNDVAQTIDPPKASEEAPVESDEGPTNS